MDRIKTHFDELCEDRLEKLEALSSLYKQWNERINVVSRKDIGQIEKHHILHSLLLSKYIRFKPDTQILDLGCGGGLPGLPLAIYFPRCRFTLIDARRKKIEVVQRLIEKLDLQNCRALHLHSTQLDEKFEFVLARAVARLEKLWSWSMPLLDIKEQKNSLPNGLIAYKGGQLDGEIKELPRRVYVEVVELSDYIDLEYYSEKKLVYVQR